ncbi:hypothetical protein [Undibacterium rugosum]|uniref:Uncharacterized protein n=1 Tax=Undibacterium rugosum TaxID=2762291 RepID=A0A923I2I5_9BURK|nr:hypothetical protein [Undibacterium rugosum]MBC3935307.1 hypothetical protein [Undibacterium rugosum]MBR7779881.1 hypothetical protein [Undibacterium rugosum]
MSASLKKSEVCLLALRCFNVAAICALGVWHAYALMSVSKAAQQGIHLAPLKLIPAEVPSPAFKAPTRI